MKQTDTDRDVFETAAQEQTVPVAPGEIIIGTITGIDAQGLPLVNYNGNPSGQPLAAISTLSITPGNVGRNVALLFAKGDLLVPVIMGLIHSALHDLIVSYDPENNPDTSAEIPTQENALEVDSVTVDGRRVVIEGKEEVVIRCGEASITLTKAGKILIRGNYLLNRSTGVNRILGGSVQVN